jgi:uncharacterized membrane protein required for colicin V production
MYLCSEKNGVADSQKVEADLINVLIMKEKHKSGLSTPVRTILAVLVVFIVLLGTPIICGISRIDTLLSQLFGALIGVACTATITMLLLHGQTSNEEKREKNVQVFKEKLKLYMTLLEKLQDIIQDVENQEDEAINKSVEKFKNLILQTSYLQLHADSERVIEIRKKLAEIIEAIITMQTSEQKLFSGFYNPLSEKLSKLSHLLKQDLLEDQQKGEITEEDSMKPIFDACDKYLKKIETNWVEIQKCFWNELGDQLTQKGYKPIQDNHLADSIQKYYAQTHNRHQWYGISFDVYKGSVEFRVEIGDQYYYGFPRKDKPENVFLEDYIKNTKDFQSNEYWYGWKYPSSDDYKLDFWKQDSPGFKRLKHPRERESFMKEIVNEIDTYIRDFTQKATEAGL